MEPFIYLFLGHNTSRSRKPRQPSSGSAVGLNQIDRYRVARLATADASGRPLVVPVCFACSARCLYSVIDEKPKRVAAGRLRRIQNIRANPRVCLLADHYEEDWSRLAYILVQGTAEVLAKGPEHRAAIKLLRRKYPQYRAMTLEDKPVIKITPHRLIAWKAA